VFAIKNFKGVKNIKLTGSSSSSSTSMVLHQRQQSFHSKANTDSGFKEVRKLKTVMRTTNIIPKSGGNTLVFLDPTSLFHGRGQTGKMNPSTHVALSVVTDDEVVTDSFKPDRANKLHQFELALDALKKQKVGTFVALVKQLDADEQLPDLDQGKLGYPFVLDVSGLIVPAKAVASMDRLDVFAQPNADELLALAEQAFRATQEGADLSPEQVESMQQVYALLPLQVPRGVVFNNCSTRTCLHVRFSANEELQRIFERMGLGDGVETTRNIDRLLGGSPDVLAQFLVAANVLTTNKSGLKVLHPDSPEGAVGGEVSVESAIAEYTKFVETSSLVSGGELGQERKQLLSTITEELKK
jgi:hypothetical protein